ncbi:spore coat associated protein CotJA [Clostridium sp. MCC353]|nr:spore coat associated protein CotJA [Clostridium sp. MCC353]
MPPLRPPVIQPRQAVEPARSAMPMPQVPSACPDTSVGGMERYSLAMAYVPWQQWKQTYALDRGFQRGTIFPELDLPFVMGRCR